LPVLYSINRFRGGWFKTELHLKYTEPLTTEYICTDQVKGDEMRGNVARTREKRNLYRVFWGMPGRKISLGRHRHRCGVNIKIYLREIRWV
jgi:hypothetical protein